MSIPNPLPISDIVLYRGALSHHLLTGGGPIALTRYGIPLGYIVREPTSEEVCRACIGPETYQPEGMEAKLLKARELLLASIHEASTLDQGLEISEALEVLDAKLRSMKLMEPVRPGKVPGL